MCLAILMYLVTGTLALLWHVVMTIGIFLMTLLGKAILFVCASIYTVARPIANLPAEESSSDLPSERPFVTMYPEISNFDEDFDTMARVSLETVTSSENSPRQTRLPRPSGPSSPGTSSERDSSDASELRGKAEGKNERTANGKITEARLQRGSRQPRHQQTRHPQAGHQQTEHQQNRHQQTEHQDTGH